MLGVAVTQVVLDQPCIIPSVGQGVPTAVWQAFILPNMTVFRAKNAFGHGIPWSLPWARPVDYDPAKFPAAQRHCDTHTGVGSSRFAAGLNRMVGATASAAASSRSLPLLVFVTWFSTCPFSSM